VATFGQAQQFAQVLQHRFKHARLQPALAWLIHTRPRRQIIRHHPPLRARPDNPTQPIEHFNQAVLALRRLFAQQRQVRRRKRPFFVTHITGLRFSVHHSSLSKVHNTL
jgi:hypothetical protein